MSRKIGLNGAVSNTSLNATGPCTTCEKESQCQCGRCGDFYCSVECQRKDWPKHKYICLPMPKLVRVGQEPVVDNEIPNISIQSNHGARGKQSSKCESSPKSAYNHFPDGSCVYLEAFKSSNRCFVRSTNPSPVAERERILQEIHDFGEKSPALTSNPKIHSCALALRNERWCRVQVLTNRDNYFGVSFTDFGDKCDKTLSELRQIKESIVNLPCHVQMMHLKFITNYYSHQKFINLLSPFTQKQYKITYSKKDKSGGNVELFKWGTSISLNSLIQDLSSKYNDKDDIDNNSVRNSGKKENYENKKVDLSSLRSNGKCDKENSASKQSEIEKIQPASQVEEKIRCNGVISAKPQSKKECTVPRQIQKPCLIPPFEIIPLNENDSGSQVLIMDNSFLESGFFGCLLEKYCENLKAITEFLNEYDAGEQPYKPKANEYCLAKFENMWYRAKVDEMLSDDKFLVVYIDFTNERELSSDSIRCYPLSLDFACCTTLCGIDGLPDNMSKELTGFLEEHLKPFSVLKIDGIRMKDNVCYLKSNALLKKLNDLNLL